MRQVLTLVAIKNILVRSPTDVTNKHGWTSANYSDFPVILFQKYQMNNGIHPLHHSAMYKL
jgi:hypothetical protein